MPTHNDHQVNLPMPLEGINIVEYGVFHAGPGGTAILGDLGAEIIKIESGFGDPERYWTKIADLDMSLPNGESIMHEVSNRNKRGIYLDINTEAGKKIFHQLVKNADVFMSNLRKSTKVKLGIDYESLRQINPKLIHANVSGYGPEGPMDNLGAFDPLGQAVSGLMFAAGTGEPVLLHLGVLDQSTAIALSHAIITALFVRERRGIGQEIHVSLFGTALWLQHPNLMLASVLGVDPCVKSDRPAHSPLRNSFCCKDGQWIIGTHHPEEKYWKKFCELTDLPGLLDDRRYTDESGRPIPSRQLLEIFDRVFSGRTRDEWIEIFLSHGLMFCPVKHISEVKNDIQANANQYVVPFIHPDLGSITIPGYPVHFSHCRAGTRGPAPGLGQHTDEILEELGYSSQDIVRFKKDRVVR
ncbi:MAG: CoA transferase [Desulfobacterales bacterium]|jgi:crotonobetainyl-CoA:carnitine CoA-transferase CaiB-like acyl-CoA transferase|nr:CoA transferase [Desulfobacterales bacterium]